MKPKSKFIRHYRRGDHKVKEATMSIGVDDEGRISPVFMLADSINEFWQDHAEEIESGEKRVVINMKLVDAQEDGGEVEEHHGS